MNPQNGSYYCGARCSKANFSSFKSVVLPTPCRPISSVLLYVRASSNEKIAACTNALRAGAEN